MIHETLRSLRKENGFSQAQVSEFLSENGSSVTQKAVSRWECGASQPTIEQFLLLCRLYNVPDILAVFGGQARQEDKLNALGKKRLQEYARLLAADKEFSVPRKESPTPKLRSIPLYDLPVSAGTGQFLDSESFELIDADESVPASVSFAVRISGDSMSPRFDDGQIVYIKQQQTLLNGEIGIFLLNGDAYCKELSTGEGLRLISLNPLYQPIHVGQWDEFKVLGKVML